MTQLVNLTQYEYRALANNKYNLADGHAHNSQVPAGLLKDLPEMFVSSQKTRQIDAENKFLQSFFGLANQANANSLIKNALLCYSASTAIEIVANYLAKRGHRTALLEPTFDNIPSMNRVGVELVAIQDADFFADETLNTTLFSNVHAIFLVLPNNPTGNCLTREGFAQLAQYCFHHKKLLVVDFSFRFLEVLDSWDQYEVALNSGCDFIFIEDTGKTWPIVDLKVGMIVSSMNCHQDLAIIHNDFLLNVSPFILSILCKYIEASRASGLDEAVRDIVRVNRACLRNNLANLPFVVSSADSKVSVEWLRYLEGPADRVVRILAENAVFVLPGKNFFWKNPPNGSQHIRIALMRDQDIFEESISLMRDVLTRLRGFS